jgi:ATP-dependent exoDNAse (exonuclease V) beta subunit
MKPVGHTMILASAGSGKTHALTNRFVRLLADGARPERIAALTFTRKAAGEFFDEILKKLALAARDEAGARGLAAQLGRPELRATDFSALLQATIDAMPRLNLGTLDGFFARIVAAFPLELGLGGPGQIMEESEARIEHRAVLRQMFAPAAGRPDPAQQDFMEAFKRATFGAEEKGLAGRLDRFLKECGEVYREAPDGAAWGRPERIWPDGCAWLESAAGGAAAAASRAAAAQALAAALPWPEMTEGQRTRWETFLAAVSDWAPGAGLPDPIKYVLGNTLKVWPDVAELTFDGRKLALPPAASSALRRLAESLVGAEFGRHLEMTRGIYAILRGYESAYDEAVRRRGRLTFADLQRLLRPDRPGGRPLSRAGGSDARLFIDWRLDARIDHWLLDEFQDTSFGQWNLIDEAVQDADASRSFFYVGDVKQAIFSWRGGDARLFREIFDHYNAAAPGTISEQTLVNSWRSGPAVIAMVNRTFGDPAAWGRLFPEAAVGRWSRDWEDHRSARPAIVGRAELRHADDEAARFAATLAILQETDALARGLTVAVLVPANATATELAEYLRREGGLAAVAESDLEVGLDNPLTCALLALLRAAAYPGDTAAWTHLRMTPLGEGLRREGLDSPDALTRHLLGELAAGGFEGALAAWSRWLEPSLAPDDRFSRERARQLVAAARTFDDTGGRSVADFLAFMEHYAVRDADPGAVVRVMTIHRAKGLGFDLVILPDLEGQKLARRREGLGIRRNPDRSVDWVLHLPGAEFLHWDPVLSASVAEAEADACYERFCLLYVAMTRAKRALYVITEPVGTSKSMNFPRLLHETLGETWSEGDPRWFEADGGSVLPPPPSLPPASVAGSPAGADLPGSAAGSPVGLTPAAFPRAVRRAARRPSAEPVESLGADLLFSLFGAKARDFGAAVHRLLARVEWISAADPHPLGGSGPTLSRSNGARGEAVGGGDGRGGGAGSSGRGESGPGAPTLGTPRDREPDGTRLGEEEGPALVEARACLADPALADLWTRPPGPRSEVWRERPFEIVLDGTWVSGVFDRVVVERAESGAAIRADVYDFKTDRTESPARHAGQLDLYRRSVALLTALPPAAVSAELVYTASRRRITTPAPLPA